MTRFSLRRVWGRLTRLAGRDLWQRRLEDLGFLRRALVTVLRMAAVVARGFGRHQLTTRAGALTYVTIFSLVPTLAVAFAMFAAFGGLSNARDALLSKTMAYLAVGVRQEVTQGIDRMLENINGGAIGATGLVFVVLAVFTLLSSIEDVFNDIWGVKRDRGYFERLTLYWTVVTVSPTLIVLGMSLPALLRRVVPLRWILERTGTMDGFFGVVLPWAFVVVGFAFLYALLNARRIPVAAALVGGIAGGTLWFAAAQAYGWYARSTVYYANVYGSLAAIPIFVFWLYLSWLIVFIGAQAAFAWQNLDRYREEILSSAPSQVSREQIALRVLAECARRFCSGEPAPLAADLAAELQTSARAINEATNNLVGLGLLVHFGEDQRLVPARDPRALSPAAVLHLLRSEGERVVPAADDSLTKRIQCLHERSAEAAAAAWDGLSFADLAGTDTANGGKGAREDRQAEERPERRDHEGTRLPEGRG